MHPMPATCTTRRPAAREVAPKLNELILLCVSHHLIVVHRWGWNITLNPDGTTTMLNPNGTKVYHSHSPPPATAA